MKTIHENLPLLDPTLCRRNKKKKKRKKKSEKKTSDESIRHRVLRTGCLINDTYAHLHELVITVTLFTTGAIGSILNALVGTCSGARRDTRKIEKMQKRDVS